MSRSNDTTVRVGPGLLGSLFIVFLVLKLTGHIDWSWWYVTLPLYGPLAVVVGVLGIVAVIWVIAVLVMAAAKSLGAK